MAVVVSMDLKELHRVLNQRQRTTRTPAATRAEESLEFSHLTAKLQSRSGRRPSRSGAVVDDNAYIEELRSSIHLRGLRAITLADDDAFKELEKLLESVQSSPGMCTGTCISSSNTATTILTYSCCLCFCSQYRSCISWVSSGLNSNTWCFTKQAHLFSTLPIYPVGRPGILTTACQLDGSCCCSVK